MNQDIPSPKAREIARQLFAYEGGAAFRVVEKLRRSISTLAGATGFRALLTRALTLAKAQAPGLDALQVKMDGSLEGLSEIRDDQVPEAGMLVIAQLLGLLAVLIGEKLALHLVLDAWPDLPALDRNLNGEERK